MITFDDYIVANFLVFVNTFFKFFSNFVVLTLEVVGTQSGLYRVLVAISRFFVLMGVYSPVFIVLTIGV